jgi:hypothetical protein
MSTRVLEAAPAVALGVSLVIQVADKAQLTLQTHYDRDASPEDRAVVLDALYEGAKRVAARYRIEELRLKIAARQETDVWTASQFTRAEDDFQANTKRRAKLIDEASTDDAAAWERSGKRGDYKPSAQAIGRVKALRDEQAKAEEERARARADNDVTAAKLRSDVAAMESEIRDLEASLAAHG